MVEAEDGLQAVDKLKESIQLQQPYHAVFIDCNMPVMNGPAAVAAMRGCGYTGVIVGFSDSFDGVDILEAAGATTVMDKPVLPATVMKIVEGL